MIKYIPYQHFEIESSHNLKFILQQGDCMCKLEIKYAYFLVPLNKESRKMRELSIVRQLNLSGNFLPLLWFRSTHKGFHEASKSLNTNLKETGIFADNMLLLGNTVEKDLMAKDRVILLLHHLGVIINLKISVLILTNKIKFFGLIKD